MTAAARAAFSAAVNIPVSNEAALQTSLNQTTAAASLMGFANYLVANPLPTTFVCTSINGEAYVASSLGFECGFLASPSRMIGADPPFLLQGGSATPRPPSSASASITTKSPRPGTSHSAPRCARSDRFRSLQVLHGGGLHQRHRLAARRLPRPVVLQLPPEVSAEKCAFGRRADVYMDKMKCLAHFHSRCPVQRTKWSTGAEAAEATAFGRAVSRRNRRV
ncbi:hypothetical protein DFJ74DRAFT_671344 [Hyaloraphidium curvatum]|nr:hypothetical protein DFJ74DRAFT_671344 [Hyaloraphidium curvatum]